MLFLQDLNIILNSFQDTAKPQLIYKELRPLIFGPSGTKVRAGRQARVVAGYPGE